MLTDGLLSVMVTVIISDADGSFLDYF